MKKGKLIVFEGGEGSGKSTAAEATYKWCIENGIDAIKSREPGGTEIGEKIRSILFEGVEEMDVITELLLFEAARREHYLKVIKPAMDAGKVVILDRFTWSTIVIQGYARGAEPALVEYLNNVSTDSIKPDMVFIMDIEVEKALERLKGRKEINRNDLETMEFHYAVRYKLNNMMHALYCNSSTIINADRPIDDCMKDIISKLKEIL